MAFLKNLYVIVEAGWYGRMDGKSLGIGGMSILRRWIMWERLWIQKSSLWSRSLGETEDSKMAKEGEHVIKWLATAVPLTFRMSDRWHIRRFRRATV